MDKVNASSIKSNRQIKINFYEGDLSSIGFTYQATL